MRRFLRTERRSIVPLRDPGPPPRFPPPRRPGSNFSSSGDELALRVASLEAWPSAGGGLLLGLTVPALAGEAPHRAAVKTAFLRVDTGGLPTLIIPYVRLHQRPAGRAATMVAAELGLARDGVAVDQQLIAKTGLRSLRVSILDLDLESERSLSLLAAAACAQLISAAAERWKIACADCRTEDGIILDKSGRRSATFARLVQDAALQKLPAVVRLESGVQFVLLRDQGHGVIADRTK